MSFISKAIGIVLLLGSLSACGASKQAQPITGALPQVSESNSRLYFYRSKVPFLAAIEPEFLVDEKSVGKAVMNQVIYRDAKPGRYQVKISSDLENPVEVILKEGETSYIKAYGTTSVIRTYHAIKEVSEEEAIKDLQGQKLLHPNPSQN